MEIWKDIKGFEGYYQISNMGNVRSLDRFDGIRNLRGQSIRPNSKRNGYLQVGLRRDSKRKWTTIHRLVATHFIDNPENRPQVNHIDGNKLNNTVDNLEWATPAQNLYHARKNNLIEAPKGKEHVNFGICGAESKSAKKVVRYDKDSKETKVYEALILTEDDGFDRTSVSKCCNKKLKTHKGYQWYFIEDFDKDIV